MKYLIEREEITMTLGFKKIVTKIFACTICAASAVQMVQSAVPLAYSKGSSELLGTNTALGSPLLNVTLAFPGNNELSWNAVAFNTKS